MPRLSTWLFISVGLLAVLALLNPAQLPVVLYKLSLVTGLIGRCSLMHARIVSFFRMNQTAVGLSTSMSRLAC